MEKELIGMPKYEKLPPEGKHLVNSIHNWNKHYSEYKTSLTKLEIKKFFEKKKR